MFITLLVENAIMHP